MHIIGLLANSFAVLLCFPLAVVMYFTDESLLKAWLYLYSSIYFTISLMYPTTLAHTLYRRQELLIAALKIMTNQETSSNQNQDVQKLRTMLKIYSDFAKIFDEMSLCYGIPTMLVTAVIFLQALVMVFAMYKEIILTGTLTPTILTSIMYSAFYSVPFNANLALNSIIRIRVR